MRNALVLSSSFTPFHQGLNRIALVVLAAALLTIGAAGDGLAATASENLGVFKTTTKRSDDLKPFPKWTKVLQKYLEEKGKQEGSCKETTFNKCHYQKWKALIAKLQGRSKKAQMKAVNDYANQRLYVLDPVNWGVKDYWASPGQFFGKNGDCEDYAILKFLTLRAAGFDNDELRIVIVRDMNLKIAHAILAVHLKKKRYIMDNQMTLVVEDRRIRHYKPIFSINESAWWRHRSAKKKSKKS